MQDRVRLGSIMEEKKRHKLIQCTACAGNGFLWRTMPCENALKGQEHSHSTPIECPRCKGDGARRVKVS